MLNIKGGRISDSGLCQLDFNLVRYLFKEYSEFIPEQTRALDKCKERLIFSLVRDSRGISLYRVSLRKGMVSQAFEKGVNC